MVEKGGLEDRKIVTLTAISPLHILQQRAARRPTAELLHSLCTEAKLNLIKISFALVRDNVSHIYQIL